MSNELKFAGEEAARIFLETFDEQAFARYDEQKLHHQLAYFFCWCKLMEDEFNG